MQEDEVLGLVGCVLSQQAARTNDGSGEKKTIAFQWYTLDRIYSDVHAEGESKGRKLGMVTSALTGYGATAA